MASQWQAGAEGEQRVADALRSLEGPNCHVFHDRLLEPGQSKVNLDHLLVYVAGVYLIDSKNWTGTVTAVGDKLHVRSASGRSWARDGTLDEITQSAARVANVGRVTVYPVLCLSGPSAATFGEPTLVRGVFVVPVDRLASWLLSRERTIDQPTCRNLAIQLAATFPSATEPAFLSLPVQRSRRAPRPTSVPHAAHRRPRQVRKSRPDRPWPKLVAGLALLALLLTPFGQGLLTGSPSALGKFLAHSFTQTLPEPAAVAWTHPCSKVPDATVARAVGHAVHRYQNGSYDTCTWGLGPKTPTAPVLVRIITGWSAQYEYVHGNKANFMDVGPTSALVVPQFTAVPGSTQAAARTTQPIVVTVTWPANAKPKNSHQVLTALAIETAKHLPTGPGSTTITVRP